MNSASDNQPNAQPAVLEQVEDWLKIGQIVGFHGLQGVAKIRPSSHHPDWVKCKLNLRANLAKQKTMLELVSAELKDRLVYAKFKDYPDRTSIEKWSGADLYALRSELPQPSSDEFWADELIGMEVIERETQQSLGVVKALATSGGTDYLEIESPKAQDTILVPFNEHFFPTSDKAQRILWAEHLVGFLD